MKFHDSEINTVIPTKVVGPIKIKYMELTEDISVPLATFEIPLWSSAHRGAIVSQKSGGISVCVIDDIMTRSIILDADNLDEILACKKWIESNEEKISNTVTSTSNYAELRRIHIENVGRLLYIRLSMHTGNASGHNMATKAADAVAEIIIRNCRNIKYVSVSGNYCTDKKNSSINGILGRGKRVSAEIIVPRSACEFVLKTTPEEIVSLNVKKNFVGSMLAGGVRSANAHYANVVLAMYLATGQDGANVVEASQGITYAEMNGTDLYFSINIPNLIVGTVGNGKHLDFAKKNLELMGCHGDDPLSSSRLSAIIASTVLCSELSLMASLTKRGDLVHSHMILERYQK